MIGTTLSSKRWYESRCHVAGFEVHMIQPLEFRFEAAEEAPYSAELYLPDGRRESLFWVVTRGTPPF